jgi:hypothetical protein
LRTLNMKARVLVQLPSALPKCSASKCTVVSTQFKKNSLCVYDIIADGGFPGVHRLLPSRTKSESILISQ